MNTLKGFMLMIVGLGFVVFALLGLSSSLNNYYGVIPDPNYDAIYGAINSSVYEGYNISEDLQKSVEGSERSGFIGDLTSFSAGIYRALKLPFDMIKVFKEIISTFFRVIPFPGWVTVGIGIMIILIVTYLILSAILRHNV